MHEYFIVANSFAAPFFSDMSEHFQEAPDPEIALRLFAKAYKHPCGLYAAGCYEDATSYHKRGPCLARWLSNHARLIEEKKPTLILSEAPGLVKLDDKTYKLRYPKAGRVVKVAAKRELRSEIK